MNKLVGGVMGLSEMFQNPLYMIGGTLAAVAITGWFVLGQPNTIQQLEQCGYTLPEARLSHAIYELYGVEAPVAPQKPAPTIRPGTRLEIVTRKGETVIMPDNNGRFTAQQLLEDCKRAEVLSAYQKTR